jgi:hypothetical protein
MEAIDISDFGCEGSGTTAGTGELVCGGDIFGSTARPFSAVRGLSFTGLKSPPPFAPAMHRRGWHDSRARAMSVGAGSSSASDGARGEATPS